MTFSDHTLTLLVLTAIGIGVLAVVFAGFAVLVIGHDTDIQVLMAFMTALIPEEPKPGAAGAG